MHSVDVLGTALTPGDMRFDTKASNAPHEHPAQRTAREVLGDTAPLQTGESPDEPHRAGDHMKRSSYEPPRSGL